MFRTGKRNFSLRDSPNKLSSIGSVSSLAKLQVSSPAKKIKISNGPKLLSSTLIADSKLEEFKDRINFDQSKVGNIGNDTTEQYVTELSEIVVNRSDDINLQDSRTNIIVSAETPPPTPDFRTETHLDLLRSTRDRLICENKSLKDQIDDVSAKVIEIRTNTIAIKHSRLTYDNLNSTLARGHQSIRDLLNKIYNPGQKIAELAESMMSELQTKQERKFEKLSLSLNCRIEEALNCIGQKKSALLHEIELHERTLMHKINEQKCAANDLRSSNGHPSMADQQKFDESESGNAVYIDQREDRCANQNDREDSVEENDNENASIQNDNEDCVILEERDVIETKDDDSLNGTSNEISKSITCDDDDDDRTDVDESSTEESRPFTPCQAQRPVI